MVEHLSRVDSAYFPFTLVGMLRPARFRSLFLTPLILRHASITFIIALLGCVPLERQHTFVACVLMHRPQSHVGIAASASPSASSSPIVGILMAASPLNVQLGGTASEASEILAACMLIILADA